MIATMMDTRSSRYEYLIPHRRPQVGYRRWVGASSLLVLLLVISAAQLHAQASAPDIGVRVDHHDITVGDPIEYKLSIRYDSTLKIIAPSIGNAIGPFSVLRDSVLDEGTIIDGRKTYARALRLTAFETGTLWTPSLSGELIDSAGNASVWSTDSLKIEVKSVLAGTNPDSADIRPLKSQYAIPVSHWIWWALGGALLIVAIVIYWLWRRRRRAVEEIAAPAVPPWEIALESLRVMRDEIDPATDNGRLWYFRLSEILRRYFDQRYGWSSIDETTTEVLRRLAKAPFAGHHRDRVEEFFLEADRVRYAKFPAKVGRPEVDWDWMRGFIEATIPLFTTEEPTESDAPPPDDVSGIVMTDAERKDVAV